MSHAELTPDTLVRRLDRLERKNRRWRRAAAALAVGIAALGLMGQSSKSLEDTFANRLEASERYLSVVSVDSMMEDVIRHLVQNVEGVQNIGEAKREEIVQLVKRAIAIDRMTRMLASLMVKHFTASELDALARFYGSPEGKSIMKKFGAYMAEATPIMEQETRQALEKLGSQKR